MMFQGTIGGKQILILFTHSFLTFNLSDVPNLGLHAVINSKNMVLGIFSSSLHPVLSSLV